MQKNLIITLLVILCSVTANLIYAQSSNIINGNVKNSQNKENLAAISIAIKGTGAGTFTDEHGNFRLVTTQKLPFVVVVSSIGFSSKEVSIGDASQVINIELDPSFALGQEVVVAASRTPQRIMESPVTIERVSSNTIRNAPGPSYYDALGNLKGVDVTNSSYTFKTVSTRGFNGSGNLRFNQLVDGMDNAAPALNFSVGNVIGLTDLDVDNMELLSGASSALYGSGGMNGTLLISSKDPFKYQEFSAEVKEGIMHVDDYRHPVSPFHDFAFRWGKKVSDKFAFKIGAEYIKANDWRADDSTDLLRNNVFSSIKTGDKTTRASDPNYDGVNVYGDEASSGMEAFAQVFQEATRQGVLKATNGSIDIVQYMNGNLPAQPSQDEINSFLAGLNAVDPSGALSEAAANLIPFNLGIRNDIYGDKRVSRTGYYEKDLVDYDAYDLKISGGLYYYITPSIEASLTGNWGQGTTVYTGADRYSLKNFSIGQYKLEVKAPTWFVRAYTTQENSGDSYATTLTALSINNTWKTNADWFGQYIGTYSTLLMQGAEDTVAHATARGVADAGRYMPGSTEYKNAFNKSVTTAISDGGSQFADKSSVYQIEGQLNLSKYVKVMDLLLGSSYRLYHLNSDNTIFFEPYGPLNTSEIGAYAQLQKELIPDVLKVTASGRYDKNANFEGHFTPRVTALISVVKDNNIRISYQQAYRFPNNQDQFINLRTPGTTLIGCMPIFAQLYDFKTYPVYTGESVVKFQTSYNASDLQQATFEKAKPETMESYEIGYRGVINRKLLIDAYYYFSQYKDFIGRKAVARGDSIDDEGNHHPTNNLAYLANPLTSANFSFVVNSSTPVKAHGWGISAQYQLNKGYTLMGNVYSDELQDVPKDFVTFFNTPKYRFNVGLSNSNVNNSHFGFNIIYKWQDDVQWQGTFGTGSIPSFGTLDAQASYRFTKQKVLIKIGGTNITNHYYRNAFGNPYIGGLFYASIGYNVF